MNKQKEVENLINAIIIEQEKVLGPVALYVANSVGVSFSKGNVIISGSSQEALESLVSSFGKMFGEASMEVTRTAFARMGFTKVQ
jgi:hypothetical protein